MRAVMMIHRTVRLKSAMVVGALLFSITGRGQYIPSPAQLSAPSSGPGNYYNEKAITLLPGFSAIATSTNSYQYYIAQNCILLNSTPSQNQNYILTTVTTQPGVTSWGTLANPTICDLRQTIQYFDGLGRPVQSIQVKGSPTGRDIVQPIAYDQYGREAVKYLPYAATAANSGGGYKAAGLTEQASFYNSPASATWAAPGVVTIPSVNSITPSFSQINFEPSPLNRVVEQGAPGADWQPVTGNNTGHTVKTIYTANDIAQLSDTANTHIAALYTISAINSDQSRTLVRASGTAGNYAAGQLYVTITMDENWKSGRGGTVEEYKDKEGRVVLKRTFNYLPGSSTPFQMLSTYYVYDDLGNLVYVLPPTSGADTDMPDQTERDNLCYQYRYDERNRLTQKKLPGKGWEYIVYNKLDQPVLTQDAVQRASNQWTVTKYDALGRIIITGLWNAASVISLATLQTSIYAGTQWDTRNYADNVLGYTIGSYPSLTKTLNINYYDDYNNIPSAPTNYTPPAIYSTQTRGLVTAVRTAVLNSINNTTPDMLTSLNYYDDEGRNVIVYKQHYLAGVATPYNYDEIVSTYDFTDDLLSTVRKHFTKNAGNTAAVLALTITNSWEYDHMGRKTSSWQQIKNGALAADSKVLVSQLEYNEIGQLYKKHLHSTDGNTFKQDIEYAYNERGWVLESNAPLFEEQLKYNTGTNKQYNGNIAYQSWGTVIAPDTKTYTYTYDRLNRLLSGTATDNYNESGIEYDLAGNISKLSRYTGGTLTDQLTYNYLVGSNPTNQLQTVNDGSGNATGLSGTATYTYDLNGNLTQDNSKGITDITYNLLNLPQTITGKSTTYTYDATGQKLRRVIGTAATDYIGGIQYVGMTTSSVAFIQTGEGRAIPDGATAYNYEYTLTDHLGNSRVNFDTGTGVARKVQEDDYYPFGLEIVRGTTPSLKNLYLYNKKELQENIGLYDYGARFYDPVIGRWTSADPSAENDASLSPYLYGFDNSVRFTDPDGRWPDGDCCGVVGAFAQGLYNDLKGAVVGTVDAVTHPVQTVTSLAMLASDPVTKIMAGHALVNAATDGYHKFKSGDANTRAAMIGGLVGEVGQLFGGEIAEVAKLGKLGKVGKLAEVTKLTEGANDVNKANDVFVVTRDGVVIPKGDKYKIPDHLVENPNRPGSYGKMENGKFKEEKLRIDPGTPPGKKGPNVSHYHKNNKSTHYVPDGKDPGFN